MAHLAFGESRATMLSKQPREQLHHLLTNLGRKVQPLWTHRSRVKQGHLILPKQISYVSHKHLPDPAGIGALLIARRFCRLPKRPATVCSARATSTRSRVA